MGQKCVSMGPLAVSPSAVTRDRPVIASTHHGTTTLSGYPPRDHHRHRQQMRFKFKRLRIRKERRPTSDPSHERVVSSACDVGKASAPAQKKQQREAEPPRPKAALSTAPARRQRLPSAAGHGCCHGGRRSVQRRPQAERGVGGA
ncbi:unnamed protein product [Arctogadus glacialis]